jgi:fasciclin domain-containing protein
VATAASNTPELSTLVTAVNKADLVNILNTAQGITVFAPTKDAFSALPKPTLDKALGDPSGLLTTVLTYHVVQGTARPNQLAGSHKTLQGGTIQVTGSGQTLRSTATPACLRQRQDRQRHRLPQSAPPQQLTPHHPARRSHRHHHAGGHALMHSAPRCHASAQLR